MFFSTALFSLSARFVSTSTNFTHVGSYRMSLIKHKKSLYYGFRDSRINKRLFRHHLFDTYFSTSYSLLACPRTSINSSFINRHNILLNRVALYSLARRQIYGYDRFLLIMRKALSDSISSPI